ncbi:hypothetical protein Bca101_071936 [Brassica carinata]
MSCLVSLTCSFAPFDTSLTRPTHFIIISSPIVNKLIALSVHNHCVLYTTTVFCTQPLSSCLYVALDVNKNVAFLGVLLYKLRGLKDHAVKQQKDPTGSHGSKEQTHMRPFLLNVFFYRKFIHAKVMHRPTGKVISVATTNARNIRTNIP